MTRAIALLLILPWLADLGHAAALPRQGATLLKTDILGVFAHPDDETGMAATLAHYALGQGRTVAHAYVTRGEGGGNMVGTQAGEALGVLREAELRDCLAILGVRYCQFLDQTDFFYTESLSATLRKWDKEEVLRKLVRLVRALRPEVIVTMNPAPNPGQHGHHQAAAVLATEAFSAAADPARFAEQLKDEGLGLWQARKLFYGGTTGTHTATIDTMQPLADGRTPADVAGEALSHHRSQGFGGFAGSPWLRRPQRFTLVKSAVTPDATAEHLLAGLPTPEPVRLVEFAPKPPTPPVAFVPRPAIARFRQWAGQQGVEHVSGDLPGDLSVIAGMKNAIFLELQPGLLDPLPAALQLELPKGWKTGPVMRAPQTEPGALPLLVVEVEPPDDALGDVQAIAHGTLSGKEIRAEARLHPVPFTRIPQARSAPALDGSDAGWEHAAVLLVGTNRTWQGRADGEADCSARVRVVHDRRHLWIDIAVRDDVVVSNIAPDDIKGHWRSDSVEICVDPAAGAEDTTGCFKVGIFPFDMTGQVRAARDADARQGPVEETAPGLRLTSHRTPDGYRVQAAVPFSLVLGPARTPGRLGFNVLIYDGDKTNAVPGENINECRLAWASRSGVQGRPEDWGRIELLR